MNSLVLVISVIICVIVVVHSKGINEEFTWSRISYVWPKSSSKRGSTRVQRQSKYMRGPDVKNNKNDPGIFFPGAVNTNRPNNNNKNNNNRENDDNPPPGITYDYVTNVPMGANRWKNKLFITVPRRRLGVPSSLNYVDINSKERHNVPLIPYPNWETNLLPSESNGNRPNDIKITSTYRVAIDACDRLWLVDTGNVEIPGNVTRIQPSQIVIIDLSTDKILHRYQFPPNQISFRTNLALITVDVTKNTCSDAYAYVPDLAGYALLVYSLRGDRSWRVGHNFFHLEPMAGDFNIAGFDFQWDDGIFSIALGAQNSQGYRRAYFHSMAGTHLYAVSTRVLRNETLATRSYHGDDFQIIGDRGADSQTSATALHEPTSVLFLNLVNQNALGCWNTNRPLSDISIVQRDDQKMVYPCDIKVYGDDVILLTNTMPRFLYGRLNYDTVNFRVWFNKVEKAIAGTKCEAPKRGSGYN